MSEFCLECWNKINGTKHSKRRYVLSRDLELCEGCGEWQHVIIMERNGYHMHNYGYIFWPLEIICCIICFIYKLLKLPYTIYKKKTKKDGVNNSA